MKRVPYLSAIGSLMYAMFVQVRPDICYEVGLVSHYHSNPGQTH